ncbi:WD repeat-containing protein 17-like [Mytilus edulis]|uniref:WD repeat-containing protein 17-like n=1 Tax=Mytilus edulis TaxID=6550 RepID=UPI0039EDEE00
MAKQVGLLPAGCQPWNVDVVAASGDRFVYCATLCVYIYQLDRKFQEFRLVSIMSEHKKTITAIAFNPRNPDLLASAGADRKVIIWNVANQKLVARMDTADTPKAIGWCYDQLDTLSFAGGKGPVQMWKFQDGLMIKTCREASGFPSNILLLRWHPKNTGRLAVGHQNGAISICNVGGKSYKNTLGPEDEDDSEVEDPVSSLQWDPLSTDYLIMCNVRAGVRLIDTESQSVIMKFTPPSAASSISAMSWINNAPGIFVTGDVRSGILRIWNVSMSKPIETIKIKKTGIHALQAITTKIMKSKDREGHVSSTSAADSPALVNQAHFAVPPAQILCTFHDGGVGLYDLGLKKWKFLREEGHIETIFECIFCPDDVDLLATASFDGTVKVWNVTNMEAVKTSPGNEGVIYSICWAPADLNCLVAGTSKKGIFIWNYTTNRITQRFHEHGESPVFGVAWNQSDSRRIMSVGQDTYCIIRLVNGEIIQKYRHPEPVFGCDWSPHNKDMLATGCGDMKVRVYYIPTTADAPLKVFTGHTAKVFKVKWCPLRESIICSGSDDGTVRVWDYTQGACICVLNGHTAPIRGLLWNTEIPYLLITGSWDYSIRIWDLRDGACIDTILDHGADVYGLTSHPDRPFLIASSSRDSTVRLWNITPLVQPLEMNIIAGKPWSEIFGTVETAMVPGQNPLMIGRASIERKIKQLELAGLKDVRPQTLKVFSKFFSQPAGGNNLWDLVSVVQGMDDALLGENYSKGIMHVKHLTKFKASEAQTLEMAKMSKFGGGIGAPTREEHLKESAKMHMQLGNIQRYCEVLVELGQWEKALAVSPGVSLEYWKSLTKRYALRLIKDESDEVVPFGVAVGDTELLISNFTTRGQLFEAVLTAQVACEGTFIPQQNSSSSPGIPNGTDLPTKQEEKLLRSCVQRLADWYFYNGSPILSACCYLSKDDVQGAIGILIRGHELELAVAMGTVLGNVSEQTYLAIEYLSRRCEHHSKWELAIDLLKLIPDNSLLLAKCCSRCSASKDEINSLHKRAGLPSTEDCLTEAEKLKNVINCFECAKYYLLSPSPEIGLNIGLQDVKKKLSSGYWDIDEVFSVLQLISCIRSDKLEQNNEMRYEVLCLCSYIGALMAIRKGYDQIVLFLLSLARTLMQRHNLTLPITDQMIEKEQKAWNVILNHKDERSLTFEIDVTSLNVSPDILTDFQNLVKKAGVEKSLVGVGPDLVASSHLPSHSDVHISVITGTRIMGLAYFLEDGKSAVSPNEALMWAKVNPFSPTGSGLRINPF